MAIRIGVGLGVVVLALCGFTCILIQKEKQGTPVFASLNKISAA